MRNKILLICTVIISILFLRNTIMAKNQYEINIDFNNTKYKLLNEKINRKLDSIIKDFKKYIPDINQTYTLEITHEYYEYKDYLSYVFFIESYTGGAHPNHKIWTITYDKNSNSIIDIDYLICKEPNILNIFSRSSRNKLFYNKNIVDTNMMLEGTKPSIDNFSNFAFSKDGIILFFEYYQIAPYSSGEFKVTIPYNKFKNIL